MVQAASYTDPVASAVSIRLTVPAADVDAIQADTVNREGFPDRLARYAWELAPGLMSHEWAHILQVASYPLLLLRAAREHRQFAGLLEALKNAELPARLPVVIAQGKEWYFSSFLESAQYRLHRDEKSIRLEAVKESEPRRGTLRELDLVEEDATIFQYRIEIGSRGTGPGYRRWLTERPRYSALFSFLTGFMSDGEALQLIPVICRVCFGTVRPIESLAAILSDIAHFGASLFLRDPDQVDDDWDAEAESLMRRRLARRFGAANAESVDIQVPAWVDAQGTITRDQHAAVAAGTPHLPASLLTRWNWDDQDLLTDVLRNPWRFFGRRARRWDDRLDRYSPPVSIYRLHAAGTNRELMLTHVSNTMRPMRAPAELGNMSMTTMLLENLRMRQLVDGALRRPVPLIPCPHADCRFHRTDLCLGWFPIPAQAPECEFPGWFANWTGLNVSDDGQWLITGKDGM